MNPTKPTNLWHYTTRDRLIEIVNSGEIWTSKSNATGAKEPSTVWVSSNPLWENTATKFIVERGVYRLMTKEEQFAEFGLGRIEISASTDGIFSWNLFCKNIAANRPLARAMEISGRENGGNPNQWFGRLKPITKEYFISAEIWDGTKWVVVQSEF